MKKTLIILLLILASSQLLLAQASKPRATYLNFSYLQSELKYDDLGITLDSDFGAAITVGRTFYLHKTPILDMIRIGIDWTFLDLNFAKYSIKIDSEYASEEDEKLKMYQAEAGMHIGPSITVTPINGFNMSAYCRYAPSYAGIYDDSTEHFSGVYGSFFVTGVSASYKVISLGIENRWGSAKYEFKEEDEDGKDSAEKHKAKLKTSGPRFYLGFRF